MRRPTDVPSVSQLPSLRLLSGEGGHQAGRRRASRWRQAAADPTEGEAAAWEDQLSSPVTR